VEGVTFVGGTAPSGGSRVEVKVRYRSQPVAAAVYPAGADWRVEFERPQEGVAPGQAAVFYRGDEVLGGGTIVEAA
jgi:tRNA-specific 2-thiouridylase